MWSKRGLIHVARQKLKHFIWPLYAFTVFPSYHQSNMLYCLYVMLISQSLSAVHVEQHLEAWMFIIWLNLQNPDGLPCPAVYLYISKKYTTDDTTLCNLLQLLYTPKEHFLLLTYSTFGNVYRNPRVSGYHAGYAAPGDRPIYGKSSFSLVE